MSNETPGLPRPHAYAAEVSRRRDAAGLTQYQLATLADLSESGVRRIERGWERKKKGDPVTQVTPSLKTVVKIAVALGWDQREAGKKAGFKAAELRDLPSMEQETVKLPHTLTMLWSELTDKQRRLISDVATEFAARNRELNTLIMSSND